MSRLRFNRISLAFLQGFNGASGLLGGIMLLLDPTGGRLQMDMEWLKSTPFPDFLVPGIVLLCFVGLGNAAGFLLTVRRYRNAGLIGAGFGIILMIWITAQVLWIGYQGFLQPLYFSTGMSQAILAFMLRKRFR